MKIKVSGGQFFADGFPLRKGFELPSGKERRISCLSEWGAGCVLLSAAGEDLSITGGGIELVRWRQGAELRPLPRRERVVRRRTFSGSGYYLQVALFSGARSAIRIEGATRYEREIPYPLLAPDCELITGQRDRLLEVRATTDEGEYISFLSLGASGAILLLEEVGEEIVCAGNEVTVTRSFPDLRGRKRITRCLWRGDRFECSREQICANAHPFMRERAGRLLLEAVLACDEGEAISLLASDLADFAALSDYFGEMRAVRDPIFDASPTAVAAEYREGDRTRAILYDFDFDPMGRITNIRREE